MNCTACKSEEVIFNSAKNFAKCCKCNNLMMNLADNWQTYPVNEGMRDMIEVSLGFQTIDTTPKKPKMEDAPETCHSCQNPLEIVNAKETILCRCSACGILTEWTGLGLRPVLVEAPGGGYNPEFQALFEQKLGFSYKVRKKPIGIVEG